jgi:hypothetical protein
MTTMQRPCEMDTVVVGIHHRRREDTRRLNESSLAYTLDVTGSRIFSDAIMGDTLRLAVDYRDLEEQIGSTRDDYVAQLAQDRTGLGPVIRRTWCIRTAPRIPLAQSSATAKEAERRPRTGEEIERLARILLAGDEEEDKETWEQLKRALDSDRPSYRRLFL